jgi:hypothetical protein
MAKAFSSPVREENKKEKRRINIGQKERKTQQVRRQTCCFAVRARAAVDIDIINMNNRQFLRWRKPAKKK